MTTTHRAASAVNGSLCDRLQRQFSTRGVAAVQGTMPSAKKEKAVPRPLDPFETAPGKQSEAVRKTSAASRSSAVRTAPTAAKPQRTAAPTAVSAAQKQRRTAAVRQRSAAVAAQRVRERSRMDVTVLPRAPFPVAAVTLLSIFTVMMMVILFSFAQNYELSSEISTLSADAESLLEQERDLALALEKRNDIRVIEDIAVNEIGMVKNHLVESRFVSVTGGDRVELASAETVDAGEGESGIFSTMLSAIGENLARLREYLG